MVTWVVGEVMSADGKTGDAPLLVERDGAVETLVINDAPRNRMGLAFMDALEAEVERLARDSGVRAVVIRGAGEENFSVGMDLKQLPEGIARMGSLEAVLDQRLRVLHAIENIPKPEHAQRCGRAGCVAALFGSIRILACFSGSASALKALSTPSSPTSPVTSGAQFSFPSAIWCSVSRYSSGV